MPIYRDGIFRPLLLFKEKEIQTILKNENWKLFEDESNEDELFLRNRIRKTILPLLIKEGLNPYKLHENFHNQENIILDEDNFIKKGIPTYLRIDSKSLTNISLGNLKTLLDAYAIILNIHPFSKKILVELRKELHNHKNFLIQNKEILFWKNPTSDMYLLPADSPILQKPSITKKEKNFSISWNDTTIEVSYDFKIDYWVDGLKILKKGNHIEISELFRVKQIPTPVRKNIPILFKENRASIILFSLWDDRYKDYTGD